MGEGRYRLRIPATGEHPRLYLTSGDLPALRARRGHGLHARIWRNLETSAQWCLGRTPRSAWIAPVTPDPRHENLYDRFYAIMGDLAITEHLAFAYALSGDAEYGRAARDWALASCRAWQREAEAPADGGKAYAVSRLLKGVAVGYDLAFDLLSPDDRDEIRETLTRIGRRYFTEYFSTPEKAGPDFHTHHAIVEFASFGVAALALLGETPDAAGWLDAVIRKFERHLLPHGLAPDGAQVEGATFWASTMQYRLFFMDALRRVTGCDLFGPYGRYMTADPALAGLATTKEPGHSRSHETFLLQPSYGQLDYCAPVLLGLARAYRRPICQHLALWDGSLGSLQQTRYVTPNGEQLLFDLGGYAYVWYDPAVPAEPDESRWSWLFRSVDEAYLRASWTPGGLLAGVRKGELAVHAGGRTVLIGTALQPPDPPAPCVRSVTDTGDAAVLRCDGKDGSALEVVLHRPDRMVIRRILKHPWQWTCHGTPERTGNTLTWDAGAAVRVVAGTLAGWEPEACREEMVVGNGLLALRDPAPTASSRATVHPSEHGEIMLDVRTAGRS
jgi:hypothetical protein